MTPALLYPLAGLGLACIGLYALIVHAHLLRKVLAFNVMGSGVFLVLAGLARSAPDGGGPDPIPHAMVITGIVVAVAATALALTLLLQVHAATGRAQLSEDRDD